MKRYSRAAWRAAAIIAMALALSLGATPFATARGGGGSEAVASSAVAFADLPPEAHGTVRSIRAGGPFPHERDGVVFGNFERLLPRRERGYYREYTVATPGVRHRGARRIVAGRGGEMYYSEDHYRSFKRIIE